MKEQIIHLEPDDDIITVRDKLGWVQATHLLLVFPDDPAAEVLHRKLDLVLLQREATRRRAQLGCITLDPVVMEHARELGIATFASVEESHRRNWRTARARLTIERADQPVPLDPALAEAGSRLRSTPVAVTPPLSRNAVLSLVSLVGTLLLVGAMIVVPGATVHLAPAANQVTITASIIADPAATLTDQASSTIPARLVGVEVEGRAAIETSGAADVPSEKARGVALFTNLVPDQVTIPQGTVIRTSAAQPIRFVTLADATLPGRVGETVEVPVEAVEPGFEGNLPVSRINQIEGPLAARLAVTNSQPTRGGDVIAMPAIAPQDMERVRALLLQQLQQRAYAEMQTDSLIALRETEFVPIESLTVVLVLAETYDGYVGQPVEKLALDMRVTVQGVAIDELLARQIVYSRLAEKVGPGFQIAADSLIFRRSDATTFDDQRRVTFVMQGAGDVSATIEPRDVRNLIRGRTISAALNRLDGELPLASPPVIEPWPGFWPLLPLLPGRIHIELDGQS